MDADNLGVDADNLGVDADNLGVENVNLGLDPRVYGGAREPGDVGRTGQGGPPRVRGSRRLPLRPTEPSGWTPACTGEPRKLVSPG